MRLIDMAIFAVLGVGVVLVLAYGFTANTGFAIAASDLAIKIGGMGKVFFIAILAVLVVLLVLLKVRSSSIENI